MSLLILFASSSMVNRDNGCLMSRLTMSFLALSEWLHWFHSSDTCENLHFWRVRYFSVMFCNDFSCIFTWLFFNYLRISLIICCSINPISGSIICACTERRNGFAISIVLAVTVWLSSGTDKTLSMLLMGTSFVPVSDYTYVHLWWYLLRLCVSKRSFFSL